LSQEIKEGEVGRNLLIVRRAGPNDRKRNN